MTLHPDPESQLLGVETRANPMLRYPPERRAYRRLGSDGHLVLSNEIDRLIDALDRAGFWQCAACDRIFPAAEDPVFAVCAECWECDDDLDSKVAFDLLTPYEIARHYAKFFNDCELGALWCDGIERDDRGLWPPRHIWLDNLFCWIGDERIRECLQSHGRQFGVRNYYLRPDAITWRGRYGWVPSPREMRRLFPGGETPTVLTPQQWRPLLKKILTPITP